MRRKLFTLIKIYFMFPGILITTQKDNFIDFKLGNARCLKQNIQYFANTFILQDDLYNFAQNNIVLKPGSELLQLVHCIFTSS